MRYQGTRDSPIKHTHISNANAVQTSIVPDHSVEKQVTALILGPFFLVPHDM